MRAALGDFIGARIIVGEIDLGAVGAIEAFGENPGDGGFAGAARADEEVGVGNAVLGDRIGQRLGDMLLADNVGETLRAVFARYDLV